jgi:glutamate-1-semialdehyde 2,1-aminomutase
VADTLTVEYNDLAAVKALFAASAEQIAAVIVEPVAANMGFVLPAAGFLAGLQSLCRQNGSLFVLDEVMTGFRVAPGGAQALWGLDPDLTCLGKVIGGGLPVGAYAGKREIMSLVAPSGPVYQAGTLSGNPLAMTAGLVTLRVLQEPGVFEAVIQATATLAQGIEAASSAECPLQVARVGSMFGVYFLRSSGVRITNYQSARANADTERYARFFHAMLERGVYFAPSQFEAGFMSAAHTGGDVEQTLQAAQESLGAMRAAS